MTVIPAEAGIHAALAGYVSMGSSLRWNDGFGGSRVFASSRYASIRTG